MNIEEEQAWWDELCRLIDIEVRAWLYAPPQREAQRRATLLRKLIAENPE